MNTRDNAAQDLLKTKSQLQNALVLELTGEIDLNGSVELRGHLLEALQTKPARLVVDLSEVSFMDSSGLATLVEALQISRKQNTELALAGLQPRVKSIFEISRLDQLFKIFTNQQEALA